MGLRGGGEGGEGQGVRGKVSRGGGEQLQLHLGRWSGGDKGKVGGRGRETWGGRGGGR